MGEIKGWEIVAEDPGGIINGYCGRPVTKELLVVGVQFASVILSIGVEAGREKVVHVVWSIVARTGRGVTLPYGVKVLTK